jgi:hypothetical protein
MSSEVTGARDLLLSSGAAAVEVIVSLMQDREVKPELRLKAAESILDRISGKNALEGGGDAGGSIAFEGVLEEWSR